MNRWWQYAAQNCSLNCIILGTFLFQCKVECDIISFIYLHFANVAKKCSPAMNSRWPCQDINETIQLSQKPPHEKPAIIKHRSSSDSFLFENIQVPILYQPSSSLKSSSKEWV